MRKPSVVLVGLVLVGIGFTLGRQAARSPADPPAGTPSVAKASPPATASHGELPAYALPNTHVHRVPDSRTGRQYEVWVDLPPSYFDTEASFPVVFVTDADYGFPLIRSLRRRVGAKGRNIEDFVLIGLSYGVGEASMPSKRRDYTPTDPFARGTPASDDYDRASTYGQAAAYRDYIERDVFPLVARRYRVDMQRKTYIGHSLGGLFGSYVLLTRPGMFRNYILGSPSLWFDRRTIFDMEAAYATGHRDLDANVAMYIGAYETTGPDPRNFRSTDMVGDLRQFERRLRDRHYPHLTLHAEVLADEDHLTVFPGMATRGLLRVLPGKGPYTGG